MISTDVMSIISAIYRCQEHHQCYPHMPGASSMLYTDVRSIITAIYRCKEHHQCYLHMP